MPILQGAAWVHPKFGRDKFRTENMSCGEVVVSGGCGVVMRVVSGGCGVLMRVVSGDCGVVMSVISGCGVVIR